MERAEILEKMIGELYVSGNIINLGTVSVEYKKYFDAINNENCLSVRCLHYMDNIIFRNLGWHLERVKNGLEHELLKTAIDEYEKKMVFDELNDELPINNTKKKVEKI
jgi:hypothetical protein